MILTWLLIGLATSDDQQWCLQLYAADGVAALFKGFSPAFARSVPANAAAFLVYEMVRQAMTTQ